MATLQSIRNHGKLLLIIMGIALLAFILGDFLTSGSTFFNSSNQTVAEVEDEEIGVNEYYAAVEQLTEAYKIETQSTDLDEDTRFALRDRAWQMLIMDKTLSQQAEKIGLSVTTDELSELCMGANPHPIIAQSRTFADENGQYNQSRMVNFINSLNQEAESPEQLEYLELTKKVWAYWENAVRLTRLQEKYTSLLNNLITANPIDAKFAFNASKDTVDVQYVQVPYFAIADATVKFTDGELQELYEQKKELYKQKPNRSIEYVSFPLVPSTADLQKVENTLKSVENLFKTGNEEEVTSIVRTHSDPDVQYEGTDYSVETIPAEYKEFAFGENTVKDACTEITLNEDVYSIARIMDCGYSKPDSVKLVAVANSDEETDQEVGWVSISDPYWPKNILEPAFNGQVGDEFTASIGTNEQKFRIEDMSVATPKVKIAIIKHTVIASSQTYTDLYNQAKQFVVANKTAEQLNKSALAQNLTATPAFALEENTHKVHDLKNSRDIIKWAFSATKGQVSDVYDCGDQLVVAALTEVNDGEYRSLESVKPELTLELTNKKKAEHIISKLKTANTLTKAAELFETDIQTAEGIVLSSDHFGAAGNEPAVVGKALTLAANQTSAPIVGNNGVYLISVGEKKASTKEFNAAEEIRNLNFRNYTIPQQAIALLEEEMNIVDNRSQFE